MKTATTFNQRCPVCTQDLPEEAYQPSCWGTPGRPCGDCNRARIRQYAKAHPEQAAEAQRRWRKKHGKAAESARQRKSKYGMTQEDFDTMMARQFYRCLGCREELTPSSHIDHDHVTGRVRGLLCSNCNLTLGLVREDPSTLRSLMAYLDYDRTRVYVYLAGKLGNERIPQIGQVIRAQGYDVMDEWHSVGPDADSYWQTYEQERGRSYEDALRGRAAQNIFLFDKAILDLTDCLVMVMPAGKSSHLELGYIAGLGKPSIILLDQEPERYEVMPNFSSLVVRSEEELLVTLDSLYPDRIENALKGNFYVRNT